MMGKYSGKRKSSKWTVAAFSYIFNISRVNAVTLSRLNDSKTPKTSKNKIFLFSCILAIHNAADYTTPSALACIEQRFAPIHITINC